MQLRRTGYLSNERFEVGVTRLLVWSSGNPSQAAPMVTPTHMPPEPAPLRVFLSFAREGSSVVPRLIAHLEKQAWGVWIYDRPSEAVPMTQTLMAHLKAELENSDLCVVFVSEAAFANSHTQEEVRLALASHAKGQLRIAVFVDAALVAKYPEARSWPEPYALLARFRYVPVEPCGIASVGAAVNELCTSLGRKYVPLLAENGRVLLLTRFYEEMDQSVERRTPRENDVFTYLVRLLESIHQAFDDGDEARATQMLQLCLLFAEKEYPDKRFEYWRILDAIHRSRAGHAPEALDSLLKMRQQPHSEALRKSGLLPAAIGHCYYALSNYEAALEHYALALKCHDADVSTASNMLLCRLRLGQKVSLPAEFGPLDTAKHYPNDNLTVLLTKAIAYRLNEQSGEAQELLERLLESNPRFPPVSEVLEEYFRVLGKQGQWHKACARFAELPAKVRNEPCVMRALAKIYRECDMITEAQSLWHTLLNSNGLDAGSLFDVIVGLWNTGDRKGALNAATLFMQQHPFPGDPFAYYVSGVAQWLFGNRDRAEYDLARSGKQRHYRTLLRD